MPIPLRNDLSAEFARSLLEYVPESGELRWKLRSDVPSHVNSRCAGNRAGTQGRLQIKGTKYLTARIIVLICTGAWPENCVDHRNHDRANERPDNIRTATWRQNALNRRRRSDNTSGHKGVRATPGGKWMVRIANESGKRLYLGTFAKKSDAVAVYRDAAETMHGEWACFD